MDTDTYRYYHAASKKTIPEYEAGYRFGLTMHYLNAQQFGPVDFSGVGIERRGFEDGIAGRPPEGYKVVPFPKKKIKNQL